MDTKKLVVLLCISSTLFFWSAANATGTSTNSGVDIIDRNCAIRFSVPQQLFPSVKTSSRSTSNNKSLFVSSRGELTLSCELNIKTDIDDGYSMYLKEPGAVVTYKAKKENWFVVSGTKGDEIFYVKGISPEFESTINGQKFLTLLTAEYKKKDSKILNPVVAKIMQSISPATPQIPDYVESLIRTKYDLLADSILDSNGYDIDESNGDWRFRQEQRANDDSGGIVVSAGYHLLLWNKADGGKVAAVTEYSSFDNDDESTTFWSYAHGTWSELHDVIPSLQLSDFWGRSERLGNDLEQCCTIKMLVPGSNKEHIQAYVEPAPDENLNYDKFIKNAKYQKLDLVWSRNFSKLRLNSKGDEQ